jgi:hypothetical protein
MLLCRNVIVLHVGPIFRIHDKKNELDIRENTDYNMCGLGYIVILQTIVYYIGPYNLSKIFYNKFITQQTYVS